MPVTIKDVAKKAGVSISTVSRVVNDSKPVSPSIRDRVEKVIEETGYEPNPVARSLVMRKSNLIGVVVPNVSSYFVGAFLNGVEEIARAYKYDIILCNTYGSSKKEDSYVDLLLSKQAAGIILISSDLSEQTHKKLVKKGTPVVFFASDTKRFEHAYSADIDMDSAVKDLIKTLAPRKDDHVVYLRDEEDTRSQKMYEDVFKSQCKALGLKGCSVKKFDYQAKEIYNVVKEVMDDKSIKAKAFLCFNEDIALGTIYALNDLGYKVPEDVRVSCMFDTKITNLLRPGITAIKRPLYDLGAVAARMVIKKVDGSKLSENHVQLPYIIMERQSTSNK